MGKLETEHIDIFKWKKWNLGLFLRKSLITTVSYESYLLKNYFGASRHFVTYFMRTTRASSTQTLQLSSFSRKNIVRSICKQLAIRILSNFRNRKLTSHTRLDTRSIFHSICQDIRTQAKDKPKSKVWQEAVVVYRVLRRQKFIYRSFRRRGCNKLLSPNWRFQTAVTHLLPSVKLGRRMIRKKPRKMI
ncbi:unnamed protein product [Albugo candida]|uniref:Uncharacterized protein n=1 Tax=Albugo candida TaxID=65357 RepID=A0A024GQR8_9STRA|nr:unnamed protein product [Albugo candida]|eukprot:CCI48881.1 unnamed protein product [Albugo candida]